jgi:hypothetical protein
MCHTCSAINAILMLLTGFSFLLAGLGAVVTVMQAELVAGIMLVIYSISLLVHGLGMCPLCKGK